MRKLESWGSEDRMIIAESFCHTSVCRTVRWSDGRTESIIANTALCKASYAGAL